MSIAPDLSALIYDTGTVSISTATDTLVGVGTAWQISAAAPVIRPGDIFVVVGYQIPIYEVTDDTHIVLSMPWPGSNLVGSTYQIIKGSPYRLDNVDVAVSVRNFVQSLAGMTPIYYVTGVAPDPDIGESGQFAIKVVAGAWQLWEKVDDAWVARGSAAGQAATVAVGTTTTGAAGTNASVVNAGTTSAAVLNFTVPRGNTGLTGATGPSYAATSTSSQVIGSTGTKTFTTQASLAYQAGARVRATSGANWMEGVVTSYSGTTLVFTADKSSGAGTLATWTINIAGQPGADGLGTGDVTAAAAFGADNRLLRSDGTGKGAQASPIDVTDAGDASGIRSIRFTGTLNISGTNLNDLVVSGFYEGDNLTNAPVAAYLYVEVLSSITNVGHTQQWAYRMGTTNIAHYYRKCVGGVWGLWREVAFTDSFPTMVTTSGAQTVSGKTLGIDTVFPTTVPPASGGVITDAGLPARLRVIAASITDWNDAGENGWYMSANAANAPELGAIWFIGQVITHNSSYCTQTVYAFANSTSTDLKMYRRRKHAGAWTSWDKIRTLDAEFDERYAVKASPVLSGTITGTYTLGGTPTFPSTVAPASGGVITNVGLPPRLRANTVLITDWDNVLESGWYWSNNTTGLNAPTVDYYIGEVVFAQTNVAHQLVRRYNTSIYYHRRRSGSSAWTAWERVYLTESELDGRYKAAATATAAGIVELATDAEVQTGTDTVRAITAANLTAKEATTAQWLANTAHRILTTDQVWASGAEVAITYAASVAPNMATFINAAITMTGNLTLANPTNPTPGQTGVIRLVHSGAARTISYGTNWKFAGGTAPAASAVSGAEDLLFYHVISATRIMATLVKGVP